MVEKSLIIVGAGLAGLSAGCYAQMNGYRSHIFEHHSQPGGVAAWWRRGDYLIDGGIHFVMGHKPGTPLYELYRELGVVPAARMVDMNSYGRFVDEASGRAVEVTGDLGRLASELKAFSAADSPAIDDLIAGARAMQGSPLLFDMGMAKPPELTGLLDQIKALWSMRSLFRYFVGKYAKPTAEYVQNIHDPWLQEFIKNLFLPDVPVWFVFMVLALLADGQMGLLEGGCQDFVLPVERLYKELGGQVTYNATVEEILVEARAERGRRHDRATGVRLADRSEHHADVVVSAADGHSTIFEMLHGRYLDARIENRYRNWKLIRPSVVVSYGVARRFAGQPPFTTVILEHPFTVGCQAIKGFYYRILNYSPRFAPPGKTVLQAAFETEWDYWNDLQREDRAKYDAEKQRVADEILECLERYYPRISSQVEVTDVATPHTTWRYTLNWKGAFMGWLPTSEAMMTPIARTLPGLADFYMAGQWVLPGGGVPPCLYSGRHVVEILCRKDGKPFVVRAP